jgi:hypothetical protein
MKFICIFQFLWSLDILDLDSLILLHLIYNPAFLIFKAGHFLIAISISLLVLITTIRAPDDTLIGGN